MKNRRRWNDGRKKENGRQKAAREGLKEGTEGEGWEGLEGG